MIPQMRLMQLFPTRFRRLAATLLALLSLLSLLAFCTPPYETSPDVLEPPGPEHWLGTNDVGQDVVIGLLTATPNTVFVALSAAFLSISGALFIATLIVVTSPAISNSLLRVIDILQTIPSLLALLLIAAWVQPGLMSTIFLLAAISWYDDVRIIRVLLLRELNRENVHFARLLGAGWGYCLYRHIAPPLLPALLALYVQQVRHAALVSASLGFIGLTNPSFITWGAMMQDAVNYLFSDAWVWLLLPPALSLSLFLLAILVMGKKAAHYANMIKEHPP